MAAWSGSMLVAFKALFIVLTCIMAFALAYTLAMDGGSSCFDPSAWWIQVVETDFFVFIFAVVAWFFYKESSWYKRVAFMFMIFWCGSFTTCGYIAMLFFKLSPEESAKDPIYFVLARRQEGDVTEHTRRSYVVTTKVIVAALGCYLLGLTIYAYIRDGFPLYVEVFTPCMITSMIDVFIHTLVFSVWIAYKEFSWTCAVLWILLLVCFSGIGLYVYIIRELFYLSPDQPISQMLFNKRNIDATSSDPLLIEHSDV